MPSFFMLNVCFLSYFHLDSAYFLPVTLKNIFLCASFVAVVKSLPFAISVVSSAHKIFLLGSTIPMSLNYNKNKRGPNTDHCETTRLIALISELA